MKYNYVNMSDSPVTCYRVNPGSFVTADDRRKL